MSYKCRKYKLVFMEELLASVLTDFFVQSNFFVILERKNVQVRVRLAHKAFLRFYYLNSHTHSHTLMIMRHDWPL